MISHYHKCIFVHLPKCGGQSVENIFLSDLGLSWEDRAPLLLRHNKNKNLGPPRLAHLTYQQYVHYHYISEALWKDYYSFTVVRNPYKRVESLYKYLEFDTAVSFDRFVCVILPRLMAGRLRWFLMPQKNFIVDANGVVKVKDIFRLESINSTLPAALSQVGIHIDEVPHVNKSDNVRSLPAFITRAKKLLRGVWEPSVTVNNRINWSGAAIKMIDEVYAEDFDLLKYDKGGF